MIRLSCALCLALAICVLWTLPGAGQNLSYTFSDPDTILGCDESLTVDVVIDSVVVDLLGYSLILSYDPLLFSPTAVDPGALVNGAACSPFFTWLNSGTNEGTVEVDLAMLGCTLDGAGSILQIQFQALDTGAILISSPLGLSGTLRDGQNQVIPFTVDPATIGSFCNHAPLAVSDADTTNEDVPLTTLDVLANDQDPDGDAFVVSGFDAVSAGGGSVSYNGNGTFDYTPFEHFNGPDMFAYVISDGDMADTAQVQLLVVDVNDPPTALPDSAATDEDVPVDVAVLLNDEDVDGTLNPASVLVTAGPSHGLTSVNPGTGVVTYTPEMEWSGTDTFTYVVEDDDGAPSNPALVVLSVAGQNDPPVVTDPGTQTHVELDAVSLQIQVTDPDVGDTHTFTATGLPAGLSLDLNSGLLSGTLECGTGAGSPYACVITVADDGAPPDTTLAPFTWNVGILPVPPAIADLAATRRASGNDADGTTAVDLVWSGAPGPGNSVQVYRKGFGDYPEYDDGTGAVPTVPATPAAALAEGWSLTAVAASGGADEPAFRDFWYYVAFVLNGCGVSSPPSNLTAGTLNYHLGDVVPGPGYGNNQVNLFDISKLGNHYGTAEGHPLYVDTLDVGPTTDLSVNTRPTTDNQIQFEDLVLFAIHFNEVSAPGVLPFTAASARNAVTAWVPADLPPQGETFEVRVDLVSDGTVRAASLTLEFDPAVVAWVDYLVGDSVQQGAGGIVLLSPTPGTLDVAGMQGPLLGEKTLARIRFRVLSTGNPGFRWGSIEARNGANHPVPLEPDARTGEPTAGPVPLTTRLRGGYPNPFRADAMIRLELAAPGPVAVRIYGIDGRLVRTLVDESRPAGFHEIRWDGRDDSGREQAANVYLVRMTTKEGSSTRRLIRLR